MRLRRVGAVLFDLDGTLVDSSVDLARALNHALGRLGYPPLSVERVASYTGEGVKVLLERGLPREAWDRFEEARGIFLEFYDAHLLDTTRFYPGIEPLLDPPVAPRLGVVTNKLEAYAVKILRGLGAFERFGVVLGGDSLPVRKPDPAVLREALARLDTPPEEAAYVGDSPLDMATGRGAGVFTIGAGWGIRGRQALEEAGADVVVERPEEIPRVLAG